MSQDSDFSRHSEYFETRAIEERRMAMATKNPYARAIHLEMAERYAAAAKGGETTPVQPEKGRTRAG